MINIGDDLLIYGERLAGNPTKVPLIFKGLATLGLGVESWDYYLAVFVLPSELSLSAVANFFSALPYGD